MMQPENAASSSDPETPSGVRTALSLMAGALTLGVIAGLFDGWLDVRTQRYSELGLTRLSVDALCAAANTQAWRVPLLVAAIGGAFAALRWLLAAAGVRAATAVAWGASTAILTVALLLFVGRSVNEDPEFPPVLSLAGFLANSALVMYFTALGLLVALAPRWQPARRIARSLAGAPALAAGVAALALLGLGNAYASVAFRGTAGPGRNILLITADTLRHDHLGSYGYARDTSPNLDRLAKRGVRFEHAVVQWPKTSPSFASLLTSLYGYQTGVVRYSSQPLPLRHLAIAELLRNHGYATAGVVTNGNLARGYNFDQGFEHYVEIWRDHPEQDAEQVSDAALAWLQSHAEGDGSPFFLWLHYVDPHALYEPPPPFRGEFVGDDLYVGDRHASLNTDRDQDMGGIPGRARLGDRTDLDYYVAEYDAEIRYMDDQIGRVLKAFRDHGFEDETFVLFTADHGESLGEHDYYFEHGRLAYDASSRVPALLAGPGVPAERVVKQPVELIDVVPTLLDLAELPPHPEAQGTSWRGLLDGGNTEDTAFAFTEAGYGNETQRALRSGRWKLIHVPDAADRAIMQGTEFELYDLENDPGETRNLIDVETAVAAELREKLFARMGAAPASGAAPKREAHVDDATEEALRALGYID
jgi:arylsulfatase A-like enzyme